MFLPHMFDSAGSGADQKHDTESIQSNDDMLETHKKFEFDKLDKM